MKLTNDCYVILIGGERWTERYFREGDGWMKISARGRKFRATAEQVLNHLLPALAGVKGNVAVKVEYDAPGGSGKVRENAGGRRAARRKGRGAVTAKARGEPCRVGRGE
jgi:hypothetical protein